MPDKAPIHVDWSAARAVILEHAERRRGERAVVVIGITGPVGAGKSTLAALLTPAILATDHYLPDYDTLPREQWDDPVHSDLDLLARNLRDLRGNLAAEVPIWSFHSHAREGSRLFAPAPIIACEGLHALHETVRPLLDLAVLIEAPQHTRWSRCEKREKSGDRGWPIEAVKAFFHEVADPAYDRYARGYHAAADVIVRNGA